MVAANSKGEKSHWLGKGWPLADLQESASSFFLADSTLFWIAYSSPINYNFHHPIILSAAFLHFCPMSFVFVYCVPSLSPSLALHLS